jgi:hypothetical protein
VYAAYLYLLRVPIVGGLVLAALAPLALWKGSPAAPLLHGTFDVEPRSVGVIAFFTGLLVTALTVTTDTVVRYGSLRFAVQAPSDWMSKIVLKRAGISLTRYTTIATIAYGSAGVILVTTLLAAARPPFSAGLFSATAGCAAAIVVCGIVIMASTRTPPASARFFATILLWTPSGYLSEERDALKAARASRAARPTLLPGHGLLALATFATLVVYAIFGYSKYMTLGCVEGSAEWFCRLVPSRSGVLTDASHAVPAIPTLACILLLITLAVYVLAGLGFLLDRFRIPIVVPLVFVALASSDWPQSDNFFAVQEQSGARTAVPPQAALAAHGGNAAIIVTASGGGIHAAAWTASIAAQLEQEFGGDFHRSLRLFSAVSGGSVGTMYIVDAIEHGTFTSNSALQSAFVPATTSSLDDIAWGLVYPDLLRLFAPFLVRMDRGQAAELAWRRVAPDIARPLWAWRPGVMAGSIPAVIFNTTLSDTGGRLAIGSTDMPCDEHPPCRRGLQTFATLYDETDPAAATVDPSIVTAARLSATFTYVSPAARIDRAVRRSRAYHVVDGGYYDNYGVSSAVDWLDAATRGASSVTHVLIVQIRGPVALQDPTAKPGRGTLQQIAAPVSTLLHFRDAAQVAHNNQELQLLCQTLAARKIAIETAVFQYPKCTAPLSWHLTQPERDDVWNAYADTNLARPRARVRSFLDGEFAALGSCGVFDEQPPVFVDESCR